MRASFEQALAGSRVILCDGAMGSLLMAKGQVSGLLPEIWNLEGPAAVVAAHRSYRTAGAQILTANSIGGNRIQLRAAGLDDRVAEVNRAAARLAREAAEDDAWVAGSLGSTGHILEPLGDLSLAEVEAAYAEQAEALAEGGVDMILVETHHDLEEASAAVRMARRHTGLPVLCTFAFKARGRTMMGLRPADAARRVRDDGAYVVGANCGEGLEAVQAGIEGMLGVTELPLMAQANAGIPRLEAGATTHWDVTPEQMAERARVWVDMGVRLVGGCCGTTPEHIAAIHAALWPHS